MGQSVNTSYAVIVLGDRDTAIWDGLAVKAAERGMTIVGTYSFDPGEAAANDDLTDIAAVVGALSRAIATRTDIWVPFPVQDLVREQHIRRLSLVLQRHGLDMLMGGDLEPCTVDGGFSAIDFALRAEVRAVDALDHAGIAAAGVATLGAEIERALGNADHHGDAPARSIPPEPTDAGAKLYGTGEVARFFGKSVRWVHSAMRSGAFTRPDGSPIEPMRTANGHHRFSLPMLREMVESCYRRGIVGECELLDLLAVLSRIEQE